MLYIIRTENMVTSKITKNCFLEIFRDYIYFQDSIYDSDEREIVCRYPQFFAAKLLKESIVNDKDSLIFDGKNWLTPVLEDFDNLDGWSAPELIKMVADRKFKSKN